ncbi:MAG: transposase [Rhodospirillales bacterium]|nr:transposase [Rhodospirillales bacterium]
MLPKLRRAMVRPERALLSGPVEVDETYIGGVDRQQRGGRQRASNKSIVIGAVEGPGPACARIRPAVVDDLSGPTLGSFVAGAGVLPGSILLTDARQGYAPPGPYIDHRAVTVGASINAAVHLPHHRTFANPKTSLRAPITGRRRQHLPHTVK